MENNTLVELEDMAKNCSETLFDRIIDLNITHDTELMLNLYQLCMENSNEQNQGMIWTEFVPPFIVYTLTFVLGVVGNLLIIVAVLGYKRMKSPTNTYLVSLATADLLFCLICIPVKLAKLFSFSWTLGYWMCKFISYLENALAVCSALNLTAMSIERCYAIQYPLRARSVCTNSRAQRSVAFLWTIGPILASPIFKVQIHKEVGIVETAFWCIRDNEHSLWWRLHEIYTFFLILVVPGIIMSTSYGMIAKEMCRCCEERKHLSAHFTAPRSTYHIGNSQSAPSDKPNISLITRVKASPSLRSMDEIMPSSRHPNNSENANEDIPTKALKKTESCFPPQNKISNQRLLQRQESREKTIQVVRMLIAIIVIFDCCWTPLLTIHILQSFEVISPQIQGWAKHGKTVSSLLAYLNSALNPIIYGFMSHSFRHSFVKAMRYLIHRFCGCIEKKISRPGSKGSFQESRATSQSKKRSQLGEFMKKGQRSRPHCSRTPAISSTKKPEASRPKEQELATPPSNRLSQNPLFVTLLSNCCAHFRCQCSDCFPSNPPFLDLDTLMLERGFDCPLMSAHPMPNWCIEGAPKPIRENDNFGW